MGEDKKESYASLTPRPHVAQELWNSTIMNREDVISSDESDEDLVNFGSPCVSRELWCCNRKNSKGKEK